VAGQEVGEPIPCLGGGGAGTAGFGRGGDLLLDRASLPALPGELPRSDFAFAGVCHFCLLDLKGTRRKVHAPEIAFREAKSRGFSSSGSVITNNTERATAANAREAISVVSGSLESDSLT
jgi:hypothetical protein